MGFVNRKDSSKEETKDSLENVSDEKSFEIDRDGNPVKPKPADLFDKFHDKETAKKLRLSAVKEEIISEIKNSLERFHLTDSDKVVVLDNAYSEVKSDLGLGKHLPYDGNDNIMQIVEDITIDDLEKRVDLRETKLRELLFSDEILYPFVKKGCKLFEIYGYGMATYYDTEKLDSKLTLTHNELNEILKGLDRVFEGNLLNKRMSNLRVGGAEIYVNLGKDSKGPFFSIDITKFNTSDIPENILTVEEPTVGESQEDKLKHIPLTDNPEEEAIRFKNMLVNNRVFKRLLGDGYRRFNLFPGNKLRIADKNGVNVHFHDLHETEVPYVLNGLDIVFNGEILSKNETMMSRDKYSVTTLLKNNSGHTQFTIDLSRFDLLDE